MTLLTVGLPIYNSMPYLREAVESLLAQTVQDFKILAIVDESQDDSLAYMQSIQDNRLRLITQPKSGLTPTLNRMLREVDTPWLVRQDTDDVSYPNRLERVLDAIHKHPDAGMFYSLAEYHPRETCVGQFRCTKGSPEELRSIVKSGYLLSFCHPSVVLNVEKTLAIGGYTEGLHVEDMDLWWRMALPYDTHFIPEVLVGYRQNLSSLTARNIERQHIEGLYDQYLLLSHLHGWHPRPLEQVRDLLASIYVPVDLQAKERLRGMNMALGQRDYLRATRFALHSLLTSPKYFLGRVRDELFSTRKITNGVDPQLYLQRKAEFWS